MEITRNTFAGITLGIATPLLIIGFGGLGLSVIDRILNIRHYRRI